MSRFGSLPSVSFKRSRFDLSHGVKTSMDVGKLYPISVREVIPGDTFKCNITALARVSSSFIKPVMDNAYIDIYSFFVPYRLCYDKAEQVFGKSSPSMYVDGELEEFPLTTTPSIVTSGTVADYLGLPVGSVPAKLNIMPFRAFARIWNEWFRDENISDEVYIQQGEFSASAESLNNAVWGPSNYTGQLPFVSKKKDYFTSCLPKPQKGKGVSLTLGSFGGKVPVTSTSDLNAASPHSIIFSGTSSSSANTLLGVEMFESTYGKLKPASVSGISSSSISLGGSGMAPINLWADFTNPKSTATIEPTNVNDLRFAFQLQKMLERDARFGSRYNEYLLGHYGVVNPDSRLQFTEFLGGGRIPISVKEVQQTSQSTENSPLANVGAMSLSVGSSRFNKGFTEHGYVMTVACIRTFHTYSQGIPKMFMRENRNDIYDPLFASLGEQPVYKNELFGNKAGSADIMKGAIFGYNEAWAEYRYAPSILTGKMRPDVDDSFAIWHFGDNYASAPVLNEQFILENSTNFKRTVSVPSAPDFLVDFWFNNQAIRVMPAYSVPGLIDHH